MLALKGNQDTLCRQVKRLFDTTEWLNYRDFGTMGHATQGKGHGRREARRCVALPANALAQADAWTGMQSVVMVESMRHAGDSCTSEKRFYISSLAPDSALRVAGWNPQGGVGLADLADNPKRLFLWAVLPLLIYRIRVGPSSQSERDRQRLLHRR